METNFMDLVPTQRAVNRAVNKRLVTDDMELPEPIDYLLAMHVEYFEYINAIGTWKWWKQSHKLDKKIILDELADVIAFFLSVQISVGNAKPIIDEVMLEIATDLSKFEAKDIIQNISASIHDGLPQTSMAVMGMALVIAEKVLEVTWDEVVEAYAMKSQINIDRQKNKY